MESSPADGGELSDLPRRGPGIAALRHFLVEVPVSENMMHTLTFFPLGNANTCRIDLANGRKLLIDYAATRDADNPQRIDLPAELRRDLAEARRTSYDVVAFTHLDDDHIRGSSDFFRFEHAPKYQGAGRVDIDELWVPAAAITEVGSDGDARVIRQEARHRLLQGAGIRVFSRPARLKEWLNANGLTLESRIHCIVDAGQLVPSFDLPRDSVEFFVHSPFAERQNENDVEVRNCDAVAFQARFTAGGRDTRLLMLSDLPCDDIAAMVRVTRAYRNEDRLEWDVCGLPHHCSYLSLGPEKGVTIVKPLPDVAFLYEKKGRRGSTLISSSDPIRNEETTQPPHFQAANYYKAAVQGHGGEFIVTMEHQTPSIPVPLVVHIDALGARVQKRLGGAPGVITSRPAPRAG